jgi:hypothetical protein
LKNIFLRTLSLGEDLKNIFLRTLSFGEGRVRRNDKTEILRSLHNRLF